MYSYDGKSYPPQRDTGPAPECRIEISSPQPAETDYFLHVLTATDAGVASVPQATVRESESEITVALGETRLTFRTNAVGGRIERGGRSVELATAVP
ncbi:MAG: hypothetical protein COY42_22585 [Armatimonadetes bacterium CG_4_10_14_0_8_um_filter_66_14]|nr:MAG: hypothetical protein COY42_22585 [Armatimonadetes bacterium CG_4_10_14_0_8_um_filter_66_14]